MSDERTLPPVPGAPGARAPRVSRRSFLKYVTVAVAAAGAVPVIGCDDDGGGGGGGGGDGGSTDMGGTTTNGGGRDQGLDMGPPPDAAPDAEPDATPPPREPTDEEALPFFPQGIASGDPSPDSVMLWTRAPASDGSPVTVLFEVSTDPGFTELVASGEVVTDADSDFTVRVRVTGLSAGTRYYYRFARGEGRVSRTGHTRTAPAADDPAPVRFAFASCQDFSGRYHHAWGLLNASPEPVDFVVFLGDYVYETTGDPRFQDGAGTRRIEIPDGMPLDNAGRVRAALTLRDYRSLYAQYRADPNLREAHRLFPFVCVWDDHEFADDCWQDHATHFAEAQGSEQDTARRTAANRAWYEHMPIDVARADADFPDDLSISRRLRFGRHLEVFLTDERSYRSDHVIPEGPSNPDVGKVETNTALGARNFVLKSGFDPLEAVSGVTMLGEAQKNWLIGAIAGSEATWKVWGNEVQLAQMLVDLSPFETLPERYREVFYFSCDQWDGYRTERKEILESLAGVSGVVSIAGDIHACFVAEIAVDPDDADSRRALMEFTVPGISSTPVQEITRRTVAGSDVLSALGLGELVPRFDELVAAASPHYQFADSARNGLGVMSVGAEALEVTFWLIAPPSSPQFDGAVEAVRFRYSRAGELTRLDS